MDAIATIQLSFRVVLQGSHCNTFIAWHKPKIERVGAVINDGQDKSSYQKVILMTKWSLSFDLCRYDGFNMACRPL